MSKKFSEEALVRIWRNVKTLGNRLPTSHFGHAAVTIRGRQVPGSSGYISFWPGESAGIGKSGIRKQGGSSNEGYLADKASEMNRLTSLQLEVGYRKTNHIDYPREWDRLLQQNKKRPLPNPRGGQRPVLDSSNDIVTIDGIPLWSQSAESKTNLPGLGATHRVWGLSTRRMADWWKGFMQSNPHYQALSKQNCAGVVLWALRAGGAEAFVPLPGVTIYAEPRQVEKYAQSLGVQFDRMDQWAQEIDNDFRSAVMGGRVKSNGPPPSSQLKDGLWTMDGWKQHSHLGGLTIRSKTIREIDNHVQAFHKADWDKKFPQRYKAMVNIFLGIVTHRREKPESKRSEPLLWLANQVLALVRNDSDAW